jgi:archaellin
MEATALPNMVKAPEASKATSTAGREGIFLAGIYLGVEEGRTWTPTGESRTVTVKPQIGVSVNGEEVAVSCKDDAQMGEARRGWVKGDRIELEVEVLPPYGSKGVVKFSLPGAIERTRRGWK